VLAEDDDVILVIAPQNGPSIINTTSDYLLKYFITILNDLAILTYFISVFFLFDLFKVIGGMIVDKLEEMVVAARDRVVILVNPSLADRPSSNNMMQIRGRAERRAFADSFQEFYALRLLYPSSGGYMFPISVSSFYYFI
jgi:hypothetical protein